MANVANSLAVCPENLPLLADRMQVPRYDRRLLRPGIVHIGVGGFNRAHQAVYLDDLLSEPASLQNEAEPLPWGQCGIGLLPADHRMKDVLHAQGFLYTVVERSAAGRKARIIGSICDYVFAPERPALAIARMVSPDCRIVSMTVTEAGYFVDQGSGKFEEQHPDIRYDLDNPAAPRTFLGYLCQALDQRRLAGLPPVTVMSCDNLQGNGDITGYVVRAFAELRNPALRQWIERNVTFPNSMVDRITPATTEVERKLIEDRFGVRDGWPVFTEPFRQWVIEDRFCNGRPALERAGALMTDHVEPFELMKMRLLNGSHFAMAYLGALLGLEFVHEILEDPLMRRFIAQYMDVVAPSVPPVPGIDLPEYKSTLLQRFSNPTIRDQVARLCAGGSSKLPKFVLPVLPELMEKGRDTRLLSLVVASWLHYFRGRNERGQTLAVVDPCATELAQLVKDGGSDPRPALALHSIFGKDLPENERFIAEVHEAMESLLQRGVAQTVEHYLAAPRP